MNEFFATLKLGSLILSNIVYIAWGINAIVLVIVLIAMFSKKEGFLKVLFVTGFIMVFSLFFAIYKSGTSATKEKILREYESGEYSKEELANILCAYVKLEDIKKLSKQMEEFERQKIKYQNAELKKEFEELYLVTKNKSG